MTNSFGLWKVRIPYPGIEDSSLKWFADPEGPVC